MPMNSSSLHDPLGGKPGLKMVRVQTWWGSVPTGTFSSPSAALGMWVRKQFCSGQREGQLCDHWDVTQCPPEKCQDRRRSHKQCFLIQITPPFSLSDSRIEVEEEVKYVAKAVTEKRRYKTTREIILRYLCNNFPRFSAPYLLSMSLTRRCIHSLWNDWK